MKNFLAIDTSNAYLTVLAVLDGEKFCVFDEDCSMKHSTKLLPTVDALLQKIGKTVHDFDAFACVVGAGSFTGIRIGIATTKGFCLATGKPSVPITTFDLVAYNGKREWDKILVLCDALHGNYYACGYQGMKEVIPPSYVNEEEVKRLQKEGYTLCALTPLPLSGVQVLSPSEGLYDATVGKMDYAGELSALYIRKSQAELNLEGGHA